MGRFCRMAFGIVVVITFFGLVSGCSEEQAPGPSEPKKVVFKIERPTPKKEKSASQPPEAHQKTGTLHSKTRIEKEAERPLTVAGTKGGKKEQGVALKNIDKASVGEKVAERPRAGLKKVKAEPKTERGKQVEAQGQPSRKAPLPKGVYVVQQGESLFSISASQEVYSDPFKWPLLLWVNLTILDTMGGKGAVEHRELPPGTKVRFFTREEIEDNLKNLGNKRWVINMVSDKTTKGMSRIIVKLARAGIPSYIVMSRIRGEVWFRLRSGFFATSSEAKKMKKRIEEVAGLRGLWLSKVSAQELKAYGGLIGAGYP